LLASFRDSDVIGRIGGDEFVVLLTGADSDIAPHALARLEEWISTQGRLIESGYQIQFSVGQIQFNAFKHRTVEDLLAEADAAMYVNKVATRRQYREH
jgi:diguanylate cyclase (GGDEF)-like protein